MTFLALLQNPTDFIVNGGVFMWILLACSFVAISVIFLRLIALRKGAVIPRLIEKSIVGYRSGESLEPLRRLVKDDDSAMGQVLDAVVRSANATKAETLEIDQTRARREVVGLEDGLFISAPGSGGWVDCFSKWVRKYGVWCHFNHRSKGDCARHKGSSHQKDIWFTHRHTRLNRLVYFYPPSRDLSNPDGVVSDRVD